MYHVSLPLLMYIWMKDVKMGMGRREESGDCLAGLLYADDTDLCGESEEYLRARVECFIEVYRKRCLKVNAGKSKVILDGEEGLQCEFWVNGYI